MRRVTAKSPLSNLSLEVEALPDSGIGETTYRLAHQEERRRARE
jgi:hypothetical protein